MAKFKVGDKVIVTASNKHKVDFNVVGATGVVLEANHLSYVDFGAGHGRRLISESRIELDTSTNKSKMEIGKRYRQNSTGNEVICVGHDQGSCVVRFIDGKNRYGQDRYQNRCGKIGSDKTEWTEIGVVQRVLREVVYDDEYESVMSYNKDSSVANVAYTFEDGKLVNVTMI